jgi:hypothetical protein
VVVKIGDSGMEIQEFLGSLDLPETELTTLLLSRGAVGLLNQIVAAGRRDHLLIIDRPKCWTFSNGSPVAGQLVRTDRLWNMEFTDQPGQERFCGVGITVAVQQDSKHDPVLVHSPP